jgi:hypothetical protein
MIKGKRCPECTRVSVPGAYQCGHCGTNLERVPIRQFEETNREQFINGPDSLVDDAQESSGPVAGIVSDPGSPIDSQPPALTNLFYVLSVLSLLGGIILCGALWPGDPGYGKAWKTIAYMPAIAWLTVGIVQSGVFAAIGLGRTYLKRIADNSDRALQQSIETV